jgi:hypothetical protein
VTGLGDDAIDILEEEFVFFRKNNFEDEEDDWVRGDAREFHLYPKICRLATVPGGFFRAIRFLVVEIVEELEWTDDVHCAIDIREKRDSLLLEMVERYINTQTRKNVRWSASLCIETMPSVTKGLPTWDISLNGRKPSMKPGKRWQELFKETHRFLVARHSCEVGQMLAFKVFGYRLPIEIVELIGDTWWDQEGWSWESWLAIRGSRRR